MDKTFNDLMDIVNRTKKMDSKGSGRPAPTTNIPRTTTRFRLDTDDDDYEPREDDVVETKKRSSRASSSSLFGEDSAIGKAMTKKPKKPATKTTAKPKTTTKPKKTTKPAAKNDNRKEVKKITEKLNAVAKKTQTANVPKKETAKASPAFDANDPKNAELYSALKSALFDGGTDISEYMPDGGEKGEEAKSVLADIQAKREAQKINKEISKEQQEYEQLFNGSFFMEDAAKEEEAEEADAEKAEKKNSLSSLKEKLAELDKKAQEEDIPEKDQSEISVGNAELDRKIAEYYKRKQDKINELIKQEAEEEYEVKPEKVDDYTARQNEYEDIFSGEMVSRDEIMSSMVNTPEATESETYAVAQDPSAIESETPAIEDTAEVPATEDTAEAPVEENAEDAPAPEQEPAAEEVSEYAESVEIPEEVAVENEEGDESYIVETTAEPTEVENAPVEEGVVEGAPVEEVPEEAAPFEESLSSQYEREEKERAEQERLEAERLAEEKARLEADEKASQEMANTESGTEEVLGAEEPYETTSSDVDDYIVSANVPDEEYRPRYDEDDNNIVLDSNAVSTKLDIFDEGKEEKTEEVKEEPKTEVKEDTSDTISKEEFYNEMSRLQENLINELKGNKTEAPSVDLFAEPEPEAKEEAPAKDETEAPAEEKQLDSEAAGKLVEDIITDIKSREQEEVNEIVKEEETLTPEQKEKFESMDLLGKDNALSDADLEYIEQKKKEELEHEPEKDGYLYGSAEHKEKEEAFKDEYMSVYTEESGNTKEMGDINLNKDIANAMSSSRILEELDKKDEPAKTTSDDDDDMEMIYTLFGTQKKKVNKMENELKVLYVASECQPFIASGGLADVAGSLPKSIAKKGGVDIRVMIPMYGKIKEKYRDQFEYLGNFTVHLSWRQEYCGLFRYYKDGVTYYFVDNERYFCRDSLYGYYDDGERFAYFSKAVVESLPIIDFFPDIIHCNDWQTALVSTYIKTGNWSDYRYYQIKNVYTIHNVEYQGTYGMENLKDLFGIDYRFRNDMEYNGDINLTKAAIQFCDKLTTVSNSYCDNLKQPYCSRGLHHIIIRNEYKLCGIVNGLDTDFYNPATDTAIYKNYTVDTMQDKVMNKKIWQDELGLPVDADTPMLAIVSRLVSHKGLDLISKMMEDVLQQDIQLVVVGTGDQRFIDYFNYLQDKYPTKVRAMTSKYSNELARKAYAASDIFLMPSKIEPCGISQMISSLYGSVPIVREVGGLKDTITDFGCPEGGNGYTFTNYNPNDLKYQVERAIADFHNKPEWEKKMRICMTQDFTWSKSADKYIEMYKSLKR